jgi:hypothetical protein
VGGAIINPSPAGGPVRSVQRRAPAFTYVVLARLRSCATRPSCLQRPAGGWAAIETREPSTLNWGRGYRNDVRLSVTHSAGRPDFGTTGVTGHRRTASDAGSNARVACTLPLASFGGGGPSIPGRTAGWPAPTTRPSPAGSPWRFPPPLSGLHAGLVLYLLRRLQFVARLVEEYFLTSHEQREVDDQINHVPPAVLDTRRLAANVRAGQELHGTYVASAAAFPAWYACTSMTMRATGMDDMEWCSGK